jgi:hypothetical protein
MEKKEYWLWYWGISQTDTTIHSKKKRFTDFNKMKVYSSKHSKKHQWIGNNYWSNYDKIEKTIKKLE